ncbi:hypothetical protein TNCV_1268701 [Trichonephila clavipes]|nr:hypothetical protein TNCV_1268701 [Trichonephila clavipes]
MVDEFLESPDIRRMDWAVRYPDLIPKEHIWDVQGRNHRRAIKSKHQGMLPNSFILLDALVPMKTRHVEGSMHVKVVKTQSPHVSVAGKFGGRVPTHFHFPRHLIEAENYEVHGQ